MAGLHFLMAMSGPAGLNRPILRPKEKKMTPKIENDEKILFHVSKKLKFKLHHLHNWGPLFHFFGMRLMLPIGTRSVASKSPAGAFRGVKISNMQPQ